MFGFFRNVARIATALERLADQHVKPAPDIGPLLDLKSKFEAFVDRAVVVTDKIAAVEHTIAQTVAAVEQAVVEPAPQPVPKAPEPAKTEVLGQRRLNEAQLLARIQEFIDEGTDTYSGISSALTKGGFVNENGNKFWPASIRAQVLKHNLKPSGAKNVQHKPTPAPVRAQRVETPIVREADAPKDVSLPFEGLLSPRVAARARIVRDYKHNGGKGILSADEITAIEQFKAKRQVTQCPPCTDSTGYNHLAGAQS